MAGHSLLHVHVYINVIPPGSQQLQHTGWVLRRCAVHDMEFTCAQLAPNVD